MKLTKKQIQSAYEAIKNYVHTYVDIRQLLGEEDDLCKKCLAYFERHKHKFNPDRNESIEAFAMAKADSCLKHEARAVAREKQREKIAAFRRVNAHWEVLDQKRTAALVREALSQLPPEQVEILRCIATNESLYDLAKKRGIALRTFDRQIAAAKTAFIDIYQKLIKKGY